MNQNKDVGKYKEKLLQTFKAFISFCNSHGLEYYCCGGTAIGAIRHKGIIPWDDDIDVFMQRKDFEKLFALKKEAEEKGYGIASIKDGSNYNLPMKFYDLNTTLWEVKEIPFLSGVFIDVFPIDKTSDNRELFLKKYTKRRRLELLYQLSYSKYTIGGLWKYYQYGNIKALKKGLLSIFIPNIMQNFFRKKLLKIDINYANDNGPQLISPYGDYWGKEYLDYNWFRSSFLTPFEDFEVNLAEGTREYLAQVYGDYMKLPPKEKQVTHHYHYYVNLDKHISFEQIQKEDCFNKRT